MSNIDPFLSFPETSSDIRGEIRRFNFNGVKFSVLLTNAGFMRGGEIHSVDEHILVLKGSFKITLRINDKDVDSIVNANETIIIPKNVPHLFTAVTEVVSVEWLEGSFDIVYYEPYRKLVEEQLK